MALLNDKHVLVEKPMIHGTYDYVASLHPHHKAHAKMTHVNGEHVISPIKMWLRLVPRLTRSLIEFQPMESEPLVIMAMSLLRYRCQHQPNLT